MSYSLASRKKVVGLCSIQFVALARRVNLQHIKLVNTSNMAKKLFVGGLNYDTTQDGLQQAFSQFGAVSSATIIIDKMSGRSKGFGFVEFDDDAAADAAVAAMNGAELEGRTLTVNEARPLEPRPPRRDFDRR